MKESAKVRSWRDPVLWGVVKRRAARSRFELADFSGFVNIRRAVFLGCFIMSYRAGAP